MSNPRTAFKQINHQLYEEIMKPCRNLELVEKLLSQGADPLGLYDKTNPECVLEDFICEQSYEEEYHEEDRVIQLFFDYGMQLPGYPLNSRWFSDEELHPLWDMGFVQNEKGIRMLKVFLDNHINTDTAEDCADHILMDMAYVDGPWREGDEWWYESTCYGLKMVMLTASYEEHIQNSHYLRLWVDYENNDPSMLPRFRNWNETRYVIDPSTIRNPAFGLAEATVTIFDKTSNELIWKMRIV